MYYTKIEKKKALEKLRNTEKIYLLILHKQGKTYHIKAFTIYENQYIDLTKEFAILLNGIFKIDHAKIRNFLNKFSELKNLIGDKFKIIFEWKYNNKTHYLDK